MNSREMRIELSKIKGLGNTMINRIAEHFEKQNLLKPAEQYCYSWNGEDYGYGLFDSIEDAIKDAKQSWPERNAVYIGIAVEPGLRWFSNEEDIICSMEENLRDECGEYAENALDITDEMETVLGKMIDETIEKWINKYHIKPNCFTVINSQLYQLN